MHSLPREQRGVQTPLSFPSSSKHKLTAASNRQLFTLQAKDRLLEVMARNICLCQGREGRKYTPSLHLRYTVPADSGWERGKNPPPPFLPESNGVFQAMVFMVWVPSGRRSGLVADAASFWVGIRQPRSSLLVTTANSAKWEEEQNELQRETAGERKRRK